MPENDALRARLGKRKFIRIAVTVMCVLLVLLLVLGGAAYTIGYMLYGNIQQETMDTAVNTNLMSLREIIERDGDYTGTDYTAEEIAEVKRGIILDMYEAFLDEGNNYYDVCLLLDRNADADLSSLEGRFTKEELDFCKKAYSFGCADIVWSFASKEDKTTSDSIQVTTRPSVTTDPSVTTNPGIIVTPDKEPEPLKGVTVKDSDIYNVLIIGLDTRDDSFNGRSDTIMVVSINKATKRIVLTSFPRDLKVYDPSYGWTKINAIYPRAGNVGTSVGRLATAIQHNFGITIHDYAVVNFIIFEKVLDVFEGVDVPLYYAEYRTMYSYFDDAMKAELDAAFAGNEANSNFSVYVHLNGKQALRYARIRKVYNPVTEKNERSNDFYRNERQRQVVWGLIRNMRRLDLDKIKQIVNEILPMLATSVTYNDFLFKVMSYLDYSSYSVSSFAIPVEGTWRYEDGSVSYVIITDFEKNKSRWRAYVYG